MRKLILLVVLMAICLPVLANAEFEVPKYKWAVGYEDGLTLRRFLGEQWEIYIGGGPDGRKWDTKTINRTEYSEVPDRIETGESIDINNAGFAYLGIGRNVLRDGKLWINATAEFRYHWGDFENTYNSTDSNDDREIRELSVGHRNSNSFSIGIRPAFDITSRIVILVHYGITYEHTKRTYDTHRLQNDISESRVYSSRYVHKYDQLNLFGFNTLYSARVMFRF